VTSLEEDNNTFVIEPGEGTNISVNFPVRLYIGMDYDVAY
jgi:hypothetical protein